MPLPTDPHVYRRHLHAGCGYRAAKPLIDPPSPESWSPGQPLHWIEYTRKSRSYRQSIRIFGILAIALGANYLVYRARSTVGVSTLSQHWAMRTYQIIFLVLETISVFSLLFRLFDNWCPVNRNCISLSSIPLNLLAPYFEHPKSANIPARFAALPSIAVYIPCYNEHVSLVRQTVLAALKVNYPTSLYEVYLCDDGQDPVKRDLILRLSKHHHNVHYIIRPEHTHAKAGNLNHAIGRTDSNLIVTLDADFVARPYLIDRLLPYFYVWNPERQLYEFNETLAVVQTPQHFRNLSPFDHDPLDQRAIIFSDLVLPAKDWFNAAPVIGTTNLFSRSALTEVGYYPYHSVTEDTALSIILHGMGYRTFYVKESLATGLATTSLWSNLRQRARWLKGDWQILFSKNGPLSQRGLSIFQRILYIDMFYGRVTTIIHLFFDIVAILLLVFGVPPLDVFDPLIFLAYLGAYMVASIIFTGLRDLSGTGLGKSGAGNIAFDAIFRYATIKGLLVALVKGRNIAFKVTDKPAAQDPKTRTGTSDCDDRDSTISDNIDNDGANVSDNAGSRQSSLDKLSSSKGIAIPPPIAMTMESMTEDPSMSGRGTDTDDRSPESTIFSSEEGVRQSSIVGRRRDLGLEEQGGEGKFSSRREEIVKNLKRTWFNALMVVLLTIAVIWGLATGPRRRKLAFAALRQDGDEIEGGFEYSDAAAMGLALGFAFASLLPHALAVYLSFVPYISGWMLDDLTNGRCDQWAKDPTTGNLFVPWSYISLVSVGRNLLILGSMIFVLVMGILEVRSREL